MQLRIGDNETPNILMDTPVPDIGVAPMATTGVEFQTLQPMGAAYGTEGIFETRNGWNTPWDNIQSPVAPAAVEIWTSGSPCQESSQNLKEAQQSLDAKENFKARLGNFIR